MQDRRPTPVWLWMNRLSLDAPLVAVIWQDFLANCFPSTLRPAGRLMLGLTVWAIYLADRLLDVQLPASDAEMMPHQFCRQHQRLTGVLLAAVLCADFLIGSFWLRHSVFANGLVVSAGVITYFGIFPVRRIAVEWKPLAAAVLFTTGVFLVAWTGTVNPERTFGWPAVAFCLLCFANLVLISRWEQRMEVVSTGIGMAPLVVVCAFAGASSKWYAAVALSGAGLMALAFLGNNLSRPARRVLADAVLLSPLLLRWTSIA